MQPLCLELHEKVKNKTIVRSIQYLAYEKYQRKMAVKCISSLDIFKVCSIAIENIYAFTCH
jgi:hypothetical protein